MLPHVRNWHCYYRTIHHAYTFERR